MPFEVETPTETQAKIRIRVPRAAIDEAVEHEFGHLQQRARIPGFRPGKVPRNLLQRRFGESVLQDIRRKLVADAFEEAITERRIHPAERPTLKDEDLAPKEDGSVAVDLDLEVFPHVEPTGYDAFTVTPPPIVLHDADVDKELEALRRQSARADEVADGLAAAGDVVIADMLFQFLDGSTLPKFENRIIDTGAGLVDGVKCDDATSKFIGARRGDTVKITLKLPQEFPLEEHRGKTAVVDCTVQDLRRISLPDLSAPELLAQLGAKDLDDLRAKVRERLQQMLKIQQDRAVEELCVDQLIERHPFTVPSSFLQRSLDAERERVRRDLVNRGAPAPDIERHLLEIEGRMRQQVERRIRESYLLDRIAEKLKTRVGEQELEQQFVLMANAWQVEPQKLFDQFQEQGLLPRVVDDIRRAKVRRQLREAVRLTESDGQQKSVPLATEKSQ